MKKGRAGGKVILYALGGGLILLGAVALGGRSVARWHVARETGVANPAKFRCYQCHPPSWASPPRARAIRDLEVSFCGRTVQCHGPSEAARHATPDTGPRRPTPVSLAVSPDGGRLYVACQGQDRVVALDAAKGFVVAETEVEARPHGLAASSDGALVYVTCRDADAVLALDARDLSTRGRARTGMDPTGLALADGDRVLVVTNTGSDEISLIDAGTLAETVRFAGGREPFACAVTSDGGTVAVANRLINPHLYRTVPAAEVTTVAISGPEVRFRSRLESGHLAESVAVIPGKPLALVTCVFVRNLVPIVQVARGWVNSSALGLIDLRNGRAVHLPLDDANRCYADPAGVVVSSDGTRAYVSHGGGDRVSVIDLPRFLAAAEGDPDRISRDLSLPSTYVIARLETGRNPRGLALSPDGGRLYVAERLDDRIAVWDTRTLERVALWDLGPRVPDSSARRGERIFTSAGATFQYQFSCLSCHPDGHLDGLVYDFEPDGLGLNPLDNRSLEGLVGTAPFKWSGLNPSLHRQCGARFAMVLTRADPFGPEQLEDLVTYIESIPLPPVREPRDEHMRAARERGKAIFERETLKDGHSIPVDARCATCHTPPLYTNRMKADVGTRGPGDGTSWFDVPHLLELRRQAPYLHDGRAQTLEEIWTVFAPNDEHGKVNDLTKAELNDLIEFLKGL